MVLRERISCMELIEHYEVLKQIGKGGMGAVYQVLDHRIGKLYAGKVARGAAERQCLRREAARLKELNHRVFPYVVDYLNLPEEDWMIFEYIEGLSFQEYLEKNAPLDAKEALGFARQLCDIFAILHSQQPCIIYQDLKPENIILQMDGQLRLIDFGAALSGYGKMHLPVTMGTYGYSAPEQIERQQIDQSTDLYALGAVLFYMVTGQDPSRPPYGVTAPQNINPLLPVRICKLIMVCCQMSPSDRFQNIAELDIELKKAQNSLQKPFARRFLQWFNQISKVIFYLASLLMAGWLWFYVEAEAITDKEFLIFSIFFGVAVGLRGFYYYLAPSWGFVRTKKIDIFYSGKKMAGLGPWLISNPETK